MALREQFDAVTGAERSLVVINQTQPRIVTEMLERLFEDQPVDVSDQGLPEETPDGVYLVENGEIIAKSPLEQLLRAILLINSDLFITGTRALPEIEVPDVLAGLDDVPFRLRGYPESHKEKLVLIVISRYIERLAWEAGAGRLRTGLQSLRRISDEVGTATVYERVAGTDVDVHLYGRPGWAPTPNSSITTHAGYSDDFTDSWFVVFVPKDETDRHAALLALEEAPNEWVGWFTYREPVVRELNRTIERWL